ncbi:MAG: SGNH/GDSL hydrolase family protein, partial [Mycobacterium sp.]
MQRVLVALMMTLLVVSSGCSRADAPEASQSPKPTGTGQATEDTGTAEASESSPQPEASGDAIRYLSLGDSLTQGVGAPDEQTGSFPALLAEKWRGEGCEVELQNAGISGYTAGQILDEQVPQIEEFKPTLITFQSGGNDLANGVSADAYRSNVQAVLDAATGSGARVVVLAQNEWFRAPGFEGYSTPEARDEFDSI